jgi:PKD repeat protein/subtilisin-like proprotein convertase family protein
LKNATFCLALFFLAALANAQSFTNNTGGAIADNNTLVCFPVMVSGLPNQIDSLNFGLISVCLNINHQRMGDLDIILRAPDGTQVKLSNNSGANEVRFTNTCFREDANLPISLAISPVTGNYIPFETINRVNNLQNPNGVWQLCIIDELPTRSGSLLNFTIAFGNNPPRTPVSSICTVTNGRGCKCPDASQHCELLPDMTNSEKVIRTGYTETNGLLRLSVGTPNIGYGPLEMRTTGSCFCDTVAVNCTTVVCPNGQSPKQRVAQRVYRKDSLSMGFTDRAAGNMQYHPTHGHIHLDDWTNNSIRLRGPDPDPATWPIVGSSTKVSFCLINFYNCNFNPGYCTANNGSTLLYNDMANPGLGSASGCGNIQGIYTGYLDVYSQGLPGQDIPLNGLCNGWYNIVSITDPLNVVKESDETNNYAVVPVLLSLQQGNCCSTDFVADTLSGSAPFRVRFFDYTAPLSDKWNWSFGDGETDTTQFPVHVYTKPGLYDVSLKTNAKTTNCKDTFTRKQYILVRGAVTPGNPHNVHVYPNPFSSDLKIVYQLSRPETIEISCYDMTGKLVRKMEPITPAAGYYEQPVKLDIQSAGVYLLQVKIGDDVRNIKIMKR